MIIYLVFSDIKRSINSWNLKNYLGQLANILSSILCFTSGISLNFPFWTIFLLFWFQRYTGLKKWIGTFKKFFL